MSEVATKIDGILSCLLNMHHITEAELGRRIKIPRTTISRLVSGRTPDPRVSTLKAIADYFNVSVDQLLGNQPLFNNNKQSTIKNTTSLPIIDWNSSKDWRNVISQIKPDNHFDWVSDVVGHFAIKIQGESMWPQFQKNMILIIDAEKELSDRSFVIAYIQKNNEVIFRQLITEGSYKFLKAINPIFPLVRIGAKDKIIGVVIQTRNTYE